MAKKTLETLESPANGASRQVAMSEPYIAHVTIEGTAAMIFHKWDVESIQEKTDAVKGSKAKKTDDVESYVYRNQDNEICVPGTYFVGSIVHAAKYLQDPRSKQKSKMDMYKAGVISLTELASLGSTDWDYLDRRRVVIGRAGITRTRPAMNIGWRVSFDLQVLLPEYIPPAELNDVIQRAGRLVGIAEIRPTYGRYQVVDFKVM